MQRVIGGDLVLEFDDHGLLRAIRRRSNGYVYLECKNGGIPPWRLELRDRVKQARIVTALNARTSHVEVCQDGLRQTWSEIDEAPGVVVHVSITSQEDGLAWRLAVDGLNTNAALWQAGFPLLEHMQSIGQGDEEQWLIPKAGGYVIRNAKQAKLSATCDNVACFSYPCDLTMQFVAYYRQDRDGLLVMTQDPKGYFKRFVLQKGDAWALTVEHFPAGVPQDNGCFLLPYPVVLSAFSGDWTDAATCYRAWAIRQPWCCHGPLHTRNDIPRWLPDIGLWVWNRGTSDVVIPGTRRIRRMMQASVALDWYWWHATSYDTHFPEYLPPREGTETFRRAVHGLHLEGLRAIVYVNGRLWGTSAPSWRQKRAEVAACKQENGDFYHELYNIFDPNHAEMAPMCPTTDLWQTTMRDVVSELLDHYELDGVYLDQIGYTQAELCYDAQHGHPLGGGTYWGDGYRALIRRVRQAAQAHPEAILSTEGSCEIYLDVFDAFLVLDNSYERMGFYDKLDLNWEPIPLFAAVYHDYALHFGSYASLVPPPYDSLWPQPQSPPRSQRFHERDFTDAFHAELGRAFVAGAQPMVSNVYMEEVDDPSLQEHWSFLREVVQTRLHAAPFLVYGSWLQPPRLNVPQMTVDFLVRGLYTPPDQEHVIQRHMPTVLASLWAAPDGRQALALANISRAPQHITWVPETVSRRQKIYLIDREGRTLLDRVGNGGWTFRGTIPGRSVRVIEVAP